VTKTKYNVFPIAITQVKYVMIYLFHFFLISTVMADARAEGANAGRN
jgi:hypothetical protein